MNSFIRYFLARELRRRADEQPKLWRILSYFLLLIGILVSLALSIFSFIEDEFVWYPLITGISTFILFVIVSRLLFRRYLIEIGQLKRTILKPKKWYFISYFSLIIGILLSLLFSIYFIKLALIPLIIGVTIYSVLSKILANQKLFKKNNNT
jgi:hypothetical protein